MSELLHRNEQQFPNDETDLAELVSEIWKRRKVIFLFSIIGALLGAVYFASNWFSQPSKYTVSTNLTLNFQGIQEGKYPNGSPFSLNDITANPVLLQVYNRYELKEYGFTRRDFFESVTITPFTPSRVFIEQRYRQTLENRKLSNAEIAELNQQFSMELKNASLRFARLYFSSQLSKALPEDLALRILAAIPDEWAQRSISTYGVLDMGISLPDDIDTTQLTRNEYIASVEYLSDFNQRLVEVASRLDADEIGVMISEPETKLSAKNVINELRFLQEYTLGPLQSAFLVSPIYKDVTNATYVLNNQLVLSESRLDELRRESAAIKDILSTYANLSLEPSDGNAVSRQGSLAGAQFGDEFLSRLLTLGDELSTSKYKQDLLDRALDINLKAEAVSTKINQTKQKLNLINQSQIENSQIKNKVDEDLEYAVSSLKKYREVLLKILDIRNDKFLGTNGSLYDLSAEPIINSNFKNQVKSMVKFIFFPSLLGLFLGGFVALVLAAISRSKT
ncbi:Wzz/FepE/Etk N-terminal domain-containing protein [Planctobacterium marinum]|uniref:Polysaccharide chain length determinant N-terminal domain-containing protein n=1 Tax=Planctobacterium marinum TaxID=1631968 RepID=A0AA48KVK0_9ALTE|nr:hypothetical protein MACH26_31160 [Planctobacterium marinum]